MAIFHSFLYVHQRVYPINIPLNPIKPPFSYGFPMVNCRDSMAQEMREDSEVVLQAVSQHGLALQFAEARR